jgi:tetratricopeptide (TPR) repeat protein
MNRRALASCLLLVLALAAPRHGSAQSQQLQPVFPEANPSLVFIEGEDAVSTNFAREPILNYSCSGSRTLQLSRGTGLAEGRSYYSTFVIYLEEGGTYELWYGGTPPGPKDELYASYSSPFAYRLDKERVRPVYREDAAVVEQYAPAYYWNRVGPVALAAGPHTLEFLVSEKRRYDGRYFFYLDCFFLLRQGARPDAGSLPRVFPRNLASRAIDFPFRALEDYQIVIRDRPEEARPYVDLAQIYTLLGDYLNALKYLRRAELLDPENREIKLLIAKNRIWKGDVLEGLKAYRSLLLLEPKRLDLWQEAGKVAAWVGRYEDSVTFCRNALDQFPGELSLLVNLGLTYQWSGQASEAERLFRQAAEQAQADPRQLLDLAEVYHVNGYSPRAVQLLEEGLKRYPDRLAFYLALERIFAAEDNRSKAEETHRLIAQVFTASPQLERYLSIFERRQNLRREVIEGYEAELERHPDNLQLREVLAQTYFWTGQRAKAITETLYLLANHAFLRLTSLDREAAPLLELADRSHILLGLLDAVPAGLKPLRDELTRRIAEYAAAQKAQADFQARVQAARDKGQPPPAVTGEDPLERLSRAEADLNMATVRASTYAARITQAMEDWRAHAAQLSEFTAQEKSSAEALQKVVESTRWEWDRRDFLEQMLGMGQVLAGYCASRVYLLERNPALAEGRLRAAKVSGAEAAVFAYSLYQALLWQGKSKEALAVLQGQAAEMAVIAPYLTGLASWWEPLAAQAPPAEEPAGPAPAEAEQELKALEAEVLKARKEIQGALFALQGLLQRRLVRTMYFFEEETHPLRTELGDYYLKDENLPAAIRQFRRVLAVDPWDVDAIFRLGTVYELNRDWALAMTLYRRAYALDPAYENVTGKYNQLARQHADAVDFSAHTLADTTRLIVHGEAGYSNELNSSLGLRLGYQADGTRIYRPTTPEGPSSYLVQDLSVGLPLSLLAARLHLTPSAGVHLLSELYDDSKIGSLPSPYPLAEYLGMAAVEPHAGLELAGSLGRYLYLSGSYAFSRQEETFAPGRPRIFRHAGELSGNTDLSFVRTWPFRDSSLRTYGRIELLSDGNTMYTALQEGSFGVLSGTRLHLDVLGNVLFQDSRFAQAYIYYTPVGVLVAGGGLRGSSWIDLAEATALSVSLRASAASYQEKLFSPGELIQRLQLEGEADLSLIKGDATYSLRALLNGTYCTKNLGQPAQVRTWDYWSLYLSLGYSARLSRLLAP